ncbi:hypothetical protein KZC50_10185 [Microbacterium kitamiense]|uniref:Lipoprotein n=2 Tax=Microbacterium aurantiacum TaxID=162393 RepID=A0AAJ2HL55_9MICO|nr:hypothetical protein [Microbacterium aurantiacum]
MMTRWTGTLLLALVTGALLTGCAPDASEPTPTPSFSSDEDAFAAAEATYRAYVDALNQVDLSDPATFEPVYAWTTGEANANERKSLSQMSADGWQVEGDTVVASFLRPTAPSTDSPTAAVVCSDVSRVEVVDSGGTSVVPDARPDVYALSVTFVPEPDAEFGLKISSSNAVEDDRCGP